MKKFLALIFSLLCVGMIFVGCSKEGDKYFYDVYDFWNEKTETVENGEYYNKSTSITFSSDNITKLIETDFSEIKKYQEIFNNIKSDVELLSREFIRDPRLEGDELKNAQKKVTAYKGQLKDYEEEIVNFKNAKYNFENACANLDFEVAGIIERDEYKAFLSEYRVLINSLNGVLSNMFDCAESMFYSGKVSGFASNEERAYAVKENYFASKVLLTRDYIYFCYDHTDSTQSQSDITTIYNNYNKVKQLTLDSEKLNESKSVEELSNIDSKIEALSTWIEYYKAESNAVKNAISDGKFKYNIDDLEINNVENSIIKQNYEKYSNLINSTMKNLSETCASLVAFYKNIV